jgi:predicted metal-dependent hydrolase
VRKQESVKVVEFIEIGPVSFIRKNSGHSLKITIRPFRGVRVTMPYFISYDTAGKFVQDKISWIKNQQDKMARFESNITVFTENTLFATRDHRLSIGTHVKSTIRAIIKDQIIRINYPQGENVKDIRIQRVIRRAILAALKMEANKYLPENLRKIAGTFGFKYNRLTVRNNKSRWGSCSRDNNISLNIHLIRLPQYLCDYVIIHELCHTIHKHHQKAFWQLLDKLTGGNARKLDKELNHYNPEVY